MKASTPIVFGQGFAMERASLTLGEWDVRFTIVAKELAMEVCSMSL